MANGILPKDVELVGADPRVAIPDVDKSEARQIKFFGDIAGQAVKGVQQARAKGAVKNIGAGLSAAEELITAREAATAEGRDELTPEEIENIQASLTTERSRKAFQGIASELDQRGGGRGVASMRARVLAEREIRNISAITPGFGDEVRAAAADVLGFDPTGSTYSRLFEMQDPEPEDQLTEAEKLDKMIPGLKGTDIYKMLHSRLYASGATSGEIVRQAQETGEFDFYTNMQQTKMALDNGAMNTTQFTTKFIQNTMKSQRLPNLISRISMEAGEGGLSSMDQAQAKDAIGTLKASLMNQYHQNAVNPSQEDINRVEGAIDSQFNSTMDLVDNTNAFEILKENNDMYQQAARLGLWDTAPEFMQFAEGLTPALAERYLDLVLSSSGDPDVLQNRISASPALEKLFSPSGISNVGKYLPAAQMNVLTGGQYEMPEISKEDLAEGQDEEEAVEKLTKAATVDLIKNGGLGSEETAPQIIGSNPKLVMSEVAKNPRLLSRMPEGKAVDEFRASYFNAFKQLGDSVAATLSQEGGSLSPTMGTRYRAGSDPDRTGKVGRRPNIDTYGVEYLEEGGRKPSFWKGLFVDSPAEAQIERLNTTMAQIIEGSRNSKKIFGREVSQQEFRDIAMGYIAIQRYEHDARKAERREMQAVQKIDDLIDDKRDGIIDQDQYSRRYNQLTETMGKYQDKKNSILEGKEAIITNLKKSGFGMVVENE